MLRVVKAEPTARFWPLLFPLLLISCADGGSQWEAQHARNAPTNDGSVDGSDALSPDDTLFAHLRCFEQFASKQGPDRERDVTNWLGASQRYLSETDRTPSFVKCVLAKLGFYDPTENTFNSTILEHQYNKYKRWITVSEESQQLFVNDTQGVVLKTGSSEEVYDAFAKLFSNHSNVYFELFLRDPIVLQKLYNQKEFAVRKPNQTMIEFCELRMGEQLWGDICRIRSYEISNQTEAMEAHLNCVFRGFHYLTRDGFIGEHEIVQDFAKAAVLNDASATHIGECVKDSHREAATNKRSLRMYACLLRGESKELFMEAFDFREVRSGNLSYLLHNLPYDRQQVKHQITALDKERCDDQQRPTGRVLRH